MTDLFSRKPFILDGATGTMLQKAGLPQGVCPEKWMLENPEAIKNIQSAYAAAGSNAVYAPTFGANREKLGKFSLAGSVGEYNKRLVELSRSAVGPGISVGGDMSSLGLFIKPFGEACFDDLYEIYREQAAALAEAGVDFFALETLMTVAEARAALFAVRDVSNKPVLVTFTCDENGRTLSGTDALAALVIMQSLGVSAFGLNCSTGPDTMLKTLSAIAPHAQIPLVAKPNAGVPEIINGETVFDLSPDGLAAFAARLAEIGVSVFGGCCGTTPGHIAALSSALKAIDFASLPPPKKEADALLAASERKAISLSETEDFGEPIICDRDLAEALLDAETDSSGVTRLAVASLDDADALEENQYMINDAVSIVSENPEALARALRVYNGRSVASPAAGESKAEIGKIYASFGALRL